MSSCWLQLTSRSSGKQLTPNFTQYTNTKGGGRQGTGRLTGMTGFCQQLQWALERDKTGDTVSLSVLLAMTEDNTEKSV